MWGFRGFIILEERGGRTLQRLSEIGAEGNKFRGGRAENIN